MIGKKVIKKTFVIFSILTITCSLFLQNVSANSVVIEQKGDGNRTGNLESTCGTAKDTNYPFHGCGNFDSYFAVRVTLIDENFAKKSRTIEFRNSIDGKTRDVTDQVAIATKYTAMTDLIPASYKEKVTHQGNVNVVFGALKPGYNVFGGSSFFDSNGSLDEQLVYETRLYDRTSTDEYNLNLRRSDFINYVMSMDKKSEQKDGDNKPKVSFLELFLKLSGHENEDLIDLSSQNYSLLIEPVQQVYYRENNDDVKVVEGTTKQLTAFIYKNFKEKYDVPYSFGKWSTIRGTQIFNYACSFYVRDDFSGKHGVGNVCDSTNDFLNSYGGFFANSDLTKHLLKNGNKNNLLEKIISSDNLYGVNIIKLDEIVDISTNLNCNFVINYCDATDNNKITFDFNVTDSDGTVVTDVNDVSYDICLKNIGTQLTDNTILSDKNCYETVDYDFSSIIESLNSMNKIEPYTYLNIPSITANFSKTCYTTSLSKNDIEYPKELTFNFLGKEYKLKASDLIDYNSNDTATGFIASNPREITVSGKVKYFLKDGFGEKGNLYLNINNFTVVDAYDPISTLKIESNDEYSKYIQILTGMDDLSKDGNNIYLNLSNEDLFGTNDAKIINKLKSEPSKSVSMTLSDSAAGGPETPYNLNYTLTENGSSKKCYFTPKINDDCGSDCLPFGEKIKFRVISLSYPFPSKDGNSRLPGLNWMNEYNYVYEYITNNRNIQSTARSNEVMNPENIYLEKEPLYTITLDASTMMNIREYNKQHSYDDINLECVDGRQCSSTFLRKVVSGLEGTCANTTDFYGCADKTEKSGG